MNVFQKIKYRHFFKDIVCSEDCKQHIISLIEKKIFPKLNRFSDCILSIDEYSELQLPIGLSYHKETDSFVIINSSDPVTKQKIKLSASSIGYYISFLFELENSTIEKKYNIYSGKLSAIHIKSNNFEYNINCYIYCTNFCMSIACNQDNEPETDYITTITLRDVIFQKDCESGIIDDFCDNFYSRSFSVTDLSFLSIVEKYSKDFSVFVKHDLDSLQVQVEKGKYYLKTNYSFGKDSVCHFDSKSNDIDTLKENLASFLKPFGV